MYTYTTQAKLIGVLEGFVDVVPPGIGERDALKMLLGCLLNELDAPIDAERRFRTGSQERVDFRLGGTNPIALEIAIRAREDRNDLLARTNKSELIKLAQIPQSRVKMRYLALLDTTISPRQPERIWKSYYALAPNDIGLGVCAPVRLLYVSRSCSDSNGWP